jgi:leader peptidase (prepilin peptidase)/N-methyltransferase
MDIAIIAVLGLITGSFITLCAHRLPAGISIVHPRSRCPGCGRQIRALENVPVLSYLALRGRCHTCGARISPRYPLIELLVAGAFVVSWILYGPSLPFLKFSFFATSMILLVATDCECRQLPDEVTLTGASLGFVLAWFLPPGGFVASACAPLAGFAFSAARAAGLAGLRSAALGAAFGGGFLWLVGEGYMRLRGREGMGLGDVKTMIMVGAFLGFPLTFITIFGAVLGGSAVGLGLAGVILFRRTLRSWRRARGFSSAWQHGTFATRAFFTRLAIPFGVFLGSMAIVSWLWGVRLLAWYLGASGLQR